MAKLTMKQKVATLAEEIKAKMIDKTELDIRELNWQSAGASGLDRACVIAGFNMRFLSNPGRYLVVVKASCEFCGTEGCDDCKPETTPDRA